MATTKTKPKQTEIIIDDTIEADIIETTTPNGKTTRVSYKAPIKQNDDTTETNDESEINNDVSENENGFANVSQSLYQEIPKDKIDEFFDIIEESLSDESEPFYLRVMRIPDNFDDTFFYPMRDLTSLGVFGCRLTERYKISLLLQKINNNSGGRFNLIALDQNQKPLLRYIGFTYERGQKIAETSPIVARNVFLPNPMRDETVSNNGGQSEVKLILEAMREQHQQFMQALQNNRPQQSQIETLLLTKAVDMITNPPQQGNLEEKLLTIFAMPQMVDKMAAKMFPTPEKPAPVQNPTNWDKAIQVFNTPMVQNVAERVLSAIETIAEAKLVQNGTLPPQTDDDELTEQPAQLQPEAIDENMKTLILTVIKELESDSVIDKDNATLQALKADFPEQFENVKMFCGIADFSQVLTMLIEKSATIQPFPFEPFLNIPETQATKTYVWNETGKRVIGRLETVYNVLKAN